MHNASYLTCFNFLRSPDFSEPVSDPFSTVFHEQGSPEILQGPRGICCNSPPMKGPMNCLHLFPLLFDNVNSQYVTDICMDKNSVPSDPKLQSQTRAVALLQELDNTYWDKPMDCHSSGQDLMPGSCTNSKVQPEFKYVYEVMEISKVARRFSPSHTDLSRRHNEVEKTFVRRKFRNTKCLYTDKNFQELKEFVVSLGVLDSNKELLLMFLNQPDSIFAKHLHNLYASHTPSPVLAEGKKYACPILRRIVVLKPNIASGVEAVLLCGDPNIQIQLERLNSMTSDPEGRIPEKSFEVFGLKQCIKRKGFMT
ncbi:hypothetical protein Nepgr_012803 [Nepenthes gracilis]|uniref:DUF3741 domain-containing protein n=1 Tax=Nepenthes gracilis TaxID=150966 RepID=A0AAD3XN42_NEPGR|nr:hypothetical protein Nepgr_012803 [Nepenthes gracilis]